MAIKTRKHKSKTRKYKSKSRKSIFGGFNSFIQWMSAPNTVNKSPSMSNNKSNNIIIRFHSTECGHCIELNEIWPTIVKERSSTFRFIDVNEDSFDNRLNELNKQYNVTMVVDGFPTIYKIQNGKATYYKGDRNVKSFLKWMS